MKKTFPSILLFTLVASQLQAGYYKPISLDWNNSDYSVRYDGWENLTTFNYKPAGIGFPGNAAWPTSGMNWQSATPPGASNPTGVIRSNTEGSNSAFLYKVSNGAGGGPYPASETIYYGGMSGQLNLNGGTLGIVDLNPLDGLQTISLQVSLGEAWGYGFYNHELPTLTYYTEDGGSGTLTQEDSYSRVLSQYFNGTMPMPSGMEDVYINLWGIQYDLSLVTSKITAIEFNFTGVQHAQLWALQLDQTTEAFSGDAFPKILNWSNNGTTNNWSDNGNWEDLATPSQMRQINFENTSVNIDSNQRMDVINFTGDQGVTLSSDNGSVLTINGGITATAEDHPTDHRIQGKVVMDDFTIINIGENSALHLEGKTRSQGFYKRGEGSLHLDGETIITSNRFNESLIYGGENHIKNRVTYSGLSQMGLNVKGARLVLSGNDEQLSSNLSITLSDLYLEIGTDLVAVNATLVIGQGANSYTQTIAGLEAPAPSTPPGGLQRPELADHASVVSGTDEESTLILNTIAGTSYNFRGKLGGTGHNENNFSLIKRGEGTQILANTSSYTGSTRIEGGVLQILTQNALGNGNLVFDNGGILQISNSIAFTRGLGTGNQEFQFEGSGGFAAAGNGANAVNIDGNGRTVTWGEAQFLQDGQTFHLSGGGNTNSYIDFQNNLSLGNQLHSINVTANNAGQISGAISGEGGLHKTGDGQLYLTADNQYTGLTKISRGTVSLRSAHGRINGDVEIHPYGTLELDNSSASIRNLDRINDSAKITMYGGALTTKVVGNANSSETIGTLELKDGAIVLNSANAPSGYTNSLTITSLERDGGIINFSGTSLGTSNSNRIFISNQTEGFIGGWAHVANEFAKYSTDNGVQAFNAADYYTGGQATWLESHHIKQAGSTTAIVLSGDRTIASLNQTPTTSANSIINLNGHTLRIASGGYLGSGGSTNYTSQINNGFITAGKVTDTASELNIIRNNNHTRVDATIVDNGSGALTVNKSGGGTLRLSGANTYSGGTRLLQGILEIANSQALGTGELRLYSNTSFGVTGDSSISLVNNNDLYLSTVQIFRSSSDLNFGTGKAFLGSDSRIDGSANTLAIGSLEGTHDLEKTGAFTLSISGQSLFSGRIKVSGGILAIGSASSIGTGTVKFNGGSLRYDTASAALGDISSQLESIDHGRQISVDTNGFDVTWNHGLSGNGGLNKTGGGSLALSADSDYIGHTQIRDGILVAKTAQSMGRDGVIEFLGGTLRYGSGNTTDYSDRISPIASGQFIKIDTNGGNIAFDYSLSGQGGLEKLGAGTLLLNAVNLYSGQTIISEGVLQLGRSDALRFSHVYLNGGTLDTSLLQQVAIGELEGDSNTQLSISATQTISVGIANSESISTYSGSLTGSGVLQKSESSTLVLDGDNSNFTGSTVVNSGKLIAGHVNALGSSTTGSTRVEGGTLGINASITVANNIILSGGNMERGIATNQTYNLGTTGEIASQSGSNATKAAILASGAASQDTTLEFSFRETKGFIVNDGERKSDIFSLSGTGNDIFVLELQVANVTVNSFLGWLNTETNLWVNAVEGNVYTSGTPIGDFAGQHFTSYTEFNLAHAGLENQLGAWGVDFDTNTVWAVINHNSDFANVEAIPEPGTWAMLVSGLGAFAFWNRRRRKAAR